MTTIPPNEPLIYLNADHTQIYCDGATVPTNPDNRMYRQILALGLPILDYVPPALTADDVRKEAQRRIIALSGANNLMSCIIKQLNALMRATELADIKTSRKLTSEESAESDALRRLATVIKAVRAASNAMESGPPDDYLSDDRWP